MTNRHPTRRLAAIALVALVGLISTGCETSGPPSGEPIDGHPTTLAGSSWIVTSIGGLQPAPANRPTIAFDASSTQGSGGCNHFGGRYRYEPTTGELRFDELGMTAMACAEPERNAVETRFMQALGVANLATIEPTGHLVLTGPGGRIDLDVAGRVVTE